jgi:hypothetical protein
MTFAYPKYIKLTLNQVMTDLSTQDIPSHTKQEIIESVRNEKKRLRSIKAQRNQHTRLWAELRQPLDYEMRLVRRMVAYDNGESVRNDALNGYLLVLGKLNDRLHKLSDDGTTMPSEIAKDKKYPNNGVHWSDWVKREIKEMVLDLFDAIPKQGQKVKTPFERKIPKTLHAQLKSRLRQRTEKELINEQRKQAVDFTEARAITINKITQALAWVDASVEGEALPTTWHGFYK